MKTTTLAAVIGVAVCGHALAVTPALKHMSAATTRFYGIAPCVKGKGSCVSFVLYTISFCYADGNHKRCSPIRVRQFEYTNSADCAAQVSLMTPSTSVGWYECEPNLVSQQIAEAAPKAPAQVQRNAPTGTSYAIFICKRARACEQISKPIEPTEALCLKGIIGTLGTSKYEISNHHVFAKGERYSWYECAKPSS